MTSYNHRGPAPYFRRPEDLPVVICGPILRRVTRESVSVFVALKTAAADIRLSLYDTASPGGADALATSASPCHTVALGRLLHVAVVTLKLSSSQWLQPEQRYGYDLSIDGVRISTDYERFLGKSTVEGGGAITYGTDTLPGFVAPARQAKRLRLLYGSCRKPHGEGHDMLAAVDDRLRYAHDSPDSKWPQLLVLGGDQIYADDVSPILLRCLNDSLPIVLGWREVVPSPHVTLAPAITITADLLPAFSANELASDGTWLHSPLPDVSIASASQLSLRDLTDPLRAARIAPPRRGEEVRLNGGLSSDAASAHLVFLGEFMLMYLFCWSDALWPRDATTGRLRLPPYYEAMPSYSEFGRDALETEGQRLQAFFAGLGKVRRALANVSTLMIFDDHEVTDDWNLNADWVTRVNASPLGPRILRNALVAYAVFQDWGSQPEDYEPGQKGNEILKAVNFQVPTTPAPRWEPNQPPSAADPPPSLIADNPGALDALFAIGPSAMRPVPSSPFSGDDDPRFAIPEKTWNYLIRPHGGEGDYRIILLDTRTRRGFPSQSQLDQAISSLKTLMHDAPQSVGLVLNAALLSDSAFTAQLENQIDPGELSIVVAPAPVFGVAAVEGVLQRADVAIHNPEHADNEAWKGHAGCFLKLVELLRSHGEGGVVLLSGDVHYAFSHKITFSDGFDGMKDHASLQFCSSSFLNEASGTRLLGRSPLAWDDDGILTFSQQRGMEIQARLDAKIADMATNPLTDFFTIDGFQTSDDAAPEPSWYDPAEAALMVRDINPYALTGLFLLPMRLFSKAGVVADTLKDFLPGQVLYKVEPLKDARPASARATVELVPATTSPPPGFAMQEARHLVGYDNVGEVRVDSENGILSVTHRLYWAAHDAAQRSTSAIVSTEHTSKLTRS